MNEKDFRRYVELCLNNATENTQKNYVSILINNWLPFALDKGYELDALNIENVGDFIDSKGTVKTTTKNRYIHCFRRFLSTLATLSNLRDKRQYYLECRNEIQLLLKQETRREARDRDNKATHLLLPEIAKTLDNAFKTDMPNIRARDRALFAMLFLTGMRISECLQLTWDDISLQHRTIKVYVSKSASGARTVPIFSNALIQCLIDLRQVTPQNATFVFNRINKADRYVDLSKPLSQRGAIFNIKEKTGYNTSDARHSYIENMLAVGIGADDLRRIVGHKDLRVLESYINKHRNINLIEKYGTMSFYLTPPLPNYDWENLDDEIIDAEFYEVDDSVNWENDNQANGDTLIE